MIPIDLSVLFSNLVGLFLLIGVGFFAVRARLLPAESSKPMSTLLMKVTVPATIIHSMIRPFDPGFLRLGGCIFLIGAVIYPLFAGLSLALARLFQVPEGRRGMWCCCTTFCNNGFMGFPVALALFGEEGLTLTVILGIPFNLLLYSVGARMVCMDLPQSRSGHPLSWGRAVFSVINLSMAIGLLLYFTQLPLPQALSAPLGYLSDATTPLSMIITGMDPLIAGAALINLAMPAPAAAALLGEQYGGCTQLAARTVFLSSLLCIVTIPLVSLLL